MDNPSFRTAGDAAIRQSELSAREFEKSVERLSSGKRVNKASDDASAMAVGSRLGFARAGAEIVQNDLSFTEARAQIIDGALAKIGDVLTRMKVLALQSANGAVSNMERAFLDTEFGKLSEEIDRIGRDAEYGGQKLSGGAVFDSEFNSSSALSGITLKGGGGPGLPVLNNGQLELTNLGDAGGTAGFVSNESFALRSGITANFRYFAGSPANPADGLSFFLVDADQFDPATDTLGAPGGDLGYTGIAGGYIGVAFDEFGNFTNFNSGTFGFLPDTVSVAVGNTVVDASVTNVTGFGGIGGGFRDVRVEIDANLTLNVEMSFDGGSTFVPILDGFDLSTAAIATPDSLRFGFSAAVGGLSNDYFIDRATVITGGALNALAGDGVLSDEDRIALPLFNLTAGSFGVSQASIRTQSDAEAALSALNFGIDQMATYRADVGSSLNIVSNLKATVALNIETFGAAQSRLLDANVARESVDLVQAVMRQNAGVEMIARVHDLERRVVLGVINTIEV